MLPASFAMPTAVVLTVGGLITCFAGYRLFRIVLGIFGFVIGAMVTTQVIGAQSTIALVAAAIVGGLVGSVLMVAAYFIGVGLVGAGLAALAYPATGVSGQTPKFSQGNAVSGAMGVNGYCLRGQNPNSDTGATLYFWYDSTAGGLQTGQPTATSASTAVAGATCTAAGTYVAVT